MDTAAFAQTSAQIRTAAPGISASFDADYNTADGPQLPGFPPEIERRNSPADGYDPDRAGSSTHILLTGLVIEVDQSSAGSRTSGANAVFAGYSAPRSHALLADFALLPSNEVVSAADGVVTGSGSAFPLPMNPPVQVTVHAETDAASSGISLPHHFTRGDVMSAAGTWQDFSRYIQVLPGVVGNTDTSNDVIVRGGHPSENLFVVNGIEVPNLNHIALQGTTGGFSSMLDTSVIDAVDVKPGTYDSRYSGRLSSLVEIRTRERNPEHAASEINLGISGIGGLTQIQPHGRLIRNLLVSAHRSVLNYTTNDVGLNGVPIYTDGMATLDLHPSDVEKISLLSLNGEDSLDIDPDACDPGVTSQVHMRYAGGRSTHGGEWQHFFSPRSLSTLTLSYSRQSEDIYEARQWAPNTQNWTACRNMPLQTETLYGEHTRDGIWSTAYGIQFQKAGWLMSTGISGRLQHANYDVSQPIGQQSVLSRNPAWIDAHAFHRDAFLGQSGLYAELTGKLGNRWTILGGGRLETYAVNGAVAFDPRLSIAYRLNSHQALNVSLGHSAQLAPLVDMLSYTQNKNLRPERVNQISVGLQAWRNDWASVGLEAYRKIYSDEPVSTEYPSLMPANMVETLGQQFIWLPLKTGGRGKVEGLELIVRARLRNLLVLQNSASYSRTRYAALDGLYRPGNFDFPLVSNMLATVHMPRGVQLSARDSYSTGRPYTPFDLASSVAQSRGIYDLSRINALRGPAYNRLDLDMNRSFRIGTGTLNVYGGVENALNQKNFLSYAWESSCNSPGQKCGLNQNAIPGVPVTAVYQMPLFPSFGVHYLF